MLGRLNIGFFIFDTFPHFLHAFTVLYFWSDYFGFIQGSARNAVNICSGMVLGFPGYCKQRHYSFPRTLRWTLLFWYWLYSDKCIKGLKAPNCSQHWLLHEFLYCLSWVRAWERESVGLITWCYRQSIGLESTLICILKVHWFGWHFRVQWVWNTLNIYV